jgi:hypothetical protein
MNQRAARPGGLSTKSGRKFIRSSDGLPTAKQVRELVQQCDTSNRRTRCGRPGRKASPEYQQRVLQKLIAASNGGKGIRFLSRDEIDVVLAMCQRVRGKKRGGGIIQRPIASTAPRASRQAAGGNGEGTAGNENEEITPS